MNWTPQSMGRKGGSKSRRKLTPEQAREMVKAREEKRRLKKEEEDKEL